MWSDPWKFSRGILEDIDKEFAEAENMLNRMFRTVRETEPAACRQFPLLLWLPDNSRS